MTEKAPARRTAITTHEELRRLMAGKPGERPLGLGRPSSQASIVQTLEDRQYIEKKGKTIIPTTKGINLIACNVNINAALNSIR